MISEAYWEILEDANDHLALRFEKLQKARASRDRDGIQQAVMDYFHALQQLYATVEDAIAEQGHQRAMGV